MTGLQIRHEVDGDVGVLELRGEARLEVIAHLDEEARAARAEGARHLLLDCAGLGFMDSASAGALVRIEADLAGGGGKLVLVALPRVARRVLEASGLGDRFAAAPDLAAARTLLDPG
jgi:anti-anti-sigma factor